MCKQYLYLSPVYSFSSYEMQILLLLMVEDSGNGGKSVTKCDLQGNIPGEICWAYSVDDEGSPTSSPLLADIFPSVIK